MPSPKVDAEAIEHENYEKITTGPRRGRSSSSSTLQHDEDGQRRRSTRQPSVAALLRNPLSGMTDEEVLKDANAFVDAKGLQDHRDTFQKGALLARVQQREDGFEYVKELTDEERDVLRHEKSHRWSQPFKLYFLVILCAGSAIVQGMDQTAVNGAQVSFSPSIR